MSVFTSFAGGKFQASISGATTPTVVNVDMPSSNTEYSYTLPTGCTQFLIKLRDAGTLQLSYTAAESGTNYLTVPRRCFYSESGLTLPAGVTIYFQSPNSAQVAEIQVWTT